MCVSAGTRLVFLRAACGALLLFLRVVCFCCCCVWSAFAGAVCFRRPLQ